MLSSKIAKDTRNKMNDARVSKAFLQNFRILLKKVDAEVIVMVCVFEN